MQRRIEPKQKDLWFIDFLEFELKSTGWMDGWTVQTGNDPMIRSNLFR